VEKAFAYQPSALVFNKKTRGAIEHKISQPYERNEPVNTKNAAITGDFGIR